MLNNMAKGMSLFQYFNVVLLCVATIILVALENKAVGFTLLSFGFTSLFFTTKEFRKTIGLVYFCIALLGISPINTETDIDHVIKLGVPLASVILVPYLVTKYIYKANIINFSLRLRRKWSKREVVYFAVTILAAYILLPIILKTGGSYLNWDIENSTRS